MSEEKNNKTINTAAEPETTAPDTASAPLQDSKTQLKKDKDYVKGRRIYDIGMWLLCIVVLMNLAHTLLKFEIIIDNTSCTSYFGFVILLPVAMMIIGLIISNKTVKKYKVQENGKISLVLISTIGMFLLVINIIQIVSPTYNAYIIKDATINRGETLTAVEYVTTGIFEPAPDHLPGYHYVDIYKQNGIIAQCVSTASVNNGSYEVRNGKTSGKYLLAVQALGKEETFPFDY